MKIGLSCKAYSTDLSDTQVKTFSQLKKIGFDCLDLGINGSYCTPAPIFLQDRKIWVDYFKQLKNMIENEGLTVFQTHGTYKPDFDQDHPFEFTQKVVDQFNKEIEACAILGSKYIVIHPIAKAVMPFREQPDLALKRDDFLDNMTALKKLEPALKEFGVKACLENLFLFSLHSRHTVETGCSTPQDLLDYKNGLNNPQNYGICLDTGHLNVLWQDPISAVKTLKDNLDVLHLHDNDRSDSHQAIGTGTIDWVAFCNALKEINFKGVFNLELSYANALKISKQHAWDYIKFAYNGAKTVLQQTNLL